MIGFIVCDKALAALVPACVFVTTDDICAHVYMCLHADGGGFSCTRLCVSEMRWDGAEPRPLVLSKLRVTLKTGNSSARHVMHPAACASSVCDTAKSSGGELKMQAYRPAAPPLALGS